MKTVMLSLAFLLIVSCSSKYEHSENKLEDYQIIPKPVYLAPLTGKFLVDENTAVYAVPELENEGIYLSEMLSNATNNTLAFKNGNSGNIELKLDDSMENDEAYTLSVSYDKITISGKTPQGVFYGIQTLRQLMPAFIEEENLSGEKIVTIPAVEIKDEPRFVYRGMHLDVGRHFFPVSFIKKYIDFLAMHKMNNFHWHLTEDQGWRIEIKKYPKLTEVGATRKETIVGHGRTWRTENVKYNGEPYGGFYTQEEIKEVVKYATKMHVNVIPEIELPGHSLAAIAAYPELGNTGEQYEVGTRWGVFPEIYAPTEKTFSFLEDVFTEVIALFPSEYIHIGGDEAPKKQWENSKFAQNLMKENGLKDEHELQSYFIQRVEKFLNSKGKSIIGWDEILEGGLAPNATVMSWRGTKGGVAAAKEHHNVIMTPGHSCYFDHYQVKGKEAQAKEPLAIGGSTTVSDVYAYEPIPLELNKEEQKYILGAQGNVWTEYIPTPEHVEYMILPRMTALSEVVWSPKESKDWDDFYNRLQYLSSRFEVMDLNYAKHSIKNK